MSPSPFPETVAATAPPGLPAALASQVLGGPFEGEAHVDGVLPPWLRGRLIRTAPAVFDVDGWRSAHWFDALGMLASFEFGAKGRVRWMQRLLECEFNRSVLQGRNELGSFGTRDDRGFLQRLLQPIARNTDNTNVSIRPGARHWTALTETDRQLAIDPRTLKTTAELRFDDGLPKGLMVTAHPLDDFERQEEINVGLSYGARSSLVVFAKGWGSSERREIGRIALRRVAYIHSFAITRTRVVLVLPPYDLQPARMPWSQRAISEHYRWSPEARTRIVVMDRATGRCSEHRGPPFFFFHTVNAFDLDDGAIRLELLAYPDARVLSHGMRMSTIRAQGLPALNPLLHRITLMPGRDDFRMDVVGGHVGFEFPMLNHARVGGRPHRFVWGSDLTRVVRVDTLTDSVTQASLDDLTFGEPVFVADPDGVDEDDGVLLTVGTSARTPGSELTVWDARTLRTQARIRVPIAIPLGFHGGFETR